MANEPKPKTTTDDEQKTRSADASDDLGQAEVQQRIQQEQAQGYVGAKVDPLPNSAHSLESGPDAPPIVPDATSRVAAPHADDVVVEQKES